MHGSDTPKGLKPLAGGKTMRALRAWSPPPVIVRNNSIGRVTRAVYRRHVAEAEINRCLFRPRSRLFVLYANRSDESVLALFTQGGENTRRRLAFSYPGL